MSLVYQEILTPEESLGSLKAAAESRWLGTKFIKNKEDAVKVSNAHLRWLRRHAERMGENGEWICRRTAIEMQRVDVRRSVLRRSAELGRKELVAYFTCPKCQPEPEHLPKPDTTIFEYQLAEVS